MNPNNFTLREFNLSYTKHYYNGSQRLASKIGKANELGFIPDRGTFTSFGLPAVPTQHLDNENEILQSATNTLQDNFNEFEVTPPNLGNLELVDNYNGSGIPPSNFTYQSTPIEMFWFHPDHLGSSNYITNIEGNVSQHMEYLPFGESLVEEHLNSNNSPFRFNAKELDEETGNYYYGARYYDPKFSIWISVDPLAEQAPDWSPYRYGFNNPVRYTDPTGMFENNHIETPILDKSDANYSAEKAEAFLIFAKSKEGQEFLADYASEGQEIAGIIYSQGKYDKEGLNISFGVKELKN